MSSRRSFRGVPLPVLLMEHADSAGGVLSGLFVPGLDGIDDFGRHARRAVGTAKPKHLSVRK
jgi:hypothetical protein